MSEYKEKASQFWNVFKHYLLINTTQQPTYLLTRQHFGSYVAFGLAGYNTFLLRQKILKNAISVTKSNNPKVVGIASGIVGLYYFVGLVAVWHIPSFFAQLAVRVYCASQNATTTILFRDYLKQQIFSEKRVKTILREYK